MVALSSFNPSCYLPATITNRLPSAIACAPPSTAAKIYGYLTSPVSSTYTTVKATMDALVGLPFLSFLLIPTMTSYSTSLNLLFFYLTWSTLVLSHTPLRVEVIGSLAVRILFYIFPSLFFLGFDILLPSLSESWKSLGSDALPFLNTSRKNVIKHAKILGWCILNIVLSVLLQGLVEVILTTQLGRHSAIKVSTSLPLPWGIAKDLIKGFLLRDILAYVIHRYLLHNSNPPNAVIRDLTRLHQSWYHKAIKVPFPLSSSYDHPVPYLLRNFLPTYIPAMLFRFHALTYLFYLMIISLEETFTHSGYAVLPTNFILGGVARRNEMHCLSQGKGNFGTWGLVDWVAGTSMGGDVVEDLGDEIEAEDVKGRAKRGVNKGIGKAKRIANGNTAMNANGARKRSTRRNNSDSDE